MPATRRLLTATAAGGVLLALLSPAASGTHTDTPSGTSTTGPTETPSSTASGGESGGEQHVYAYGERTMRRGMEGDDVKLLQTYLDWLNYSTRRTGLFNADTERQVKRYEAKYDLNEDGVVPPKQAMTLRRRAKAARAAGNHIFPVRGPHSYGGPGARFGAARDGGRRRHRGQDVAARSGTPLASVTAGEVAYREYQGGGAGHYLVIYGDDGYDYVYMHLKSRPPVAPGERVRRGQRIGRVGSTGNSTGPHLHFEMWTQHWYDGGRAFDPLPYLKRWDRTS